MDKPELLVTGDLPGRDLAPMAGRRTLHLLHAATHLSGQPLPAEIHP